jgi:hypothetical protein
VTKYYSSYVAVPFLRKLKIACAANDFTVLHETNSLPGNKMYVVRLKKFSLQKSKMFVIFLKKMERQRS